MAYYYTNWNDQDYPVNFPYYNQPYYSDHHNNHNYYSSSSYDDRYGYGGYSNEQYSIRYDQNQYCNTQFHSNPYQHLPSQSLIVYHCNSAYDHPEISPQKSSDFIDPISTTGFVVSYSNTEPKTDLEFEEFDPEPFKGGYNMTETYGKPLPPSEEICYPPSKFDPTPPPPSPYGKGEQNLDIPPVKEQEKTQVVDQHQASEFDEDEEEEDHYDDDDGDDDEEQEQGEENRGVLVAPPLPGKVDQSIDQGDAKPGNGPFVNEQAREEERASKHDQEEEEEEAEEGEEEEEEEENRDYNSDEGRVEEKKPVRQIPPGYGLEALDLCEGVFGGYFPCLRKKKQENGGNQGSSGSTVGAGTEDANGYCWKTTMDYLFGDPDPYARAMPDPIYGYQRYYPQQPISEQVEYGGGNYTWSDNLSYYGYNGRGY